MRPHLIVLVAALAACTGSNSASEVPPLPWGPVPRTYKHAVVIVVDTLRGGSLGECQTPSLDALAARGDAVEKAWAGGTWTVPSTISLFTGLPVRAHGWNFAFPGTDIRNVGYPKVPDVPLLPQVLKEAGFETAGLYANPLLGRGLGFGRGFDRWNKVNDRRVVRRVKEEVEEWDDGERHFLYIHMFGPHHPLRPTVAAGERWDVRRMRNGKVSLFQADRGAAQADNYQRAYLAVVEDTDARIGRMVQALEPYREDTLIIVTSDHGELLGEHERWGHARWVWEPLTHVPLVVSDLGDLPETMNTTAVPAMVTAGLGLPHRWPEEGVRALPLVSQREDKLAISPDGRFKGVWDPESLPDAHDHLETFDLRDDPFEDQPLDAFRGRLHMVRLTWAARTPEVKLHATEEEMTPEMEEMLKELGYMGGDEEEDPEELEEPEEAEELEEE